MPEFNKLVRDKIPEKIRRNGDLFRAIKLVPGDPKSAVRSKFFLERKAKIFFADYKEDFEKAYWLQVDFIAVRRLIGALFATPDLEISTHIAGEPVLWDEAFPGEPDVQWYYIRLVTPKEFLERLTSVFGNLEEVDTNWVRKTFEFETQTTTQGTA